MAAADGAMIADPPLQMSKYEGPGVLDLSDQRLHRLDAALFCPGDSHTLILDQNHIIKLEHLERNEHLQQLSVASNRLVRMMGVSKLTHLRVLNLPNNSIGYIEGLKELLHLEWLNLAGNNIKVIEQLNACASLQHLDLSDNNVSHTGDLSRLSSLKTLLLHGNIITTLRAAPAHLPPSLVVLSLAENEIRDLSEVSYLAPLVLLEQLSIMSNPCVMPTPALPACDYRPYVVSWCLSLKVLDGYVISQKEGLKGEWLYSQGKGRAFRPGQHAQLVQYLASTCPVSSTTALQTEEDAKLERILNKQRQHQTQLQQTRHCCFQSPSRPTHLDVQQRRTHEHTGEDQDVIAQADVDPGVQVNRWMESGHGLAAARPPPAAEDPLVLEDVEPDEERLHGSLLSSESAFLPFSAAARPASAPDSGEEEFDDSLAPPTSARPRPPEEGSAGGASVSHEADGVEQLCNGSESGVEEDSQRTGSGAAVRIQAWWRGHRTRQCHPRAREVRAEIRLRRMQDHIVHLTAELESVRRQQDEERLQRRVQEEALKFLWKQLQAVLEMQACVNERLDAAHSAPSEAPLRSEISIPESGFDSAPDPGLISPDRAAGDADGSLLQQYLSSVQQRELEEQEDGAADTTPPELCPS